MWFFSVYANTVINLRYIYKMRTIYCVTDETGFKLQVSSMMEPCCWIKKHGLSAHRDERVCYPIQLCVRTDVKIHKYVKLPFRMKIYT
mgnify:CR=1 FL=1